MALGGTVSHAQVTERVAHQNDAVTVHQLLKVVRLVQCVLVLVEDVNQRAVKTSQQTLHVDATRPTSFHRHAYMVDMY